MIIGLLKEIKADEYRVGLTPGGVEAFVNKGHHVLVEKDAGVGSGFADEEYLAKGASILSSPAEVYRQSDMVIKVKEPLAAEYELLREGQILYTFLHLAANSELTEALLQKKIRAVGYETIRDKKHRLPCLTPMSEIAGRLAVQEGARYLEKPFGGRGLLLGGAPGVRHGKVAIIGGGTVGTNACKIATGMGADVVILDKDANRLVYLDDIFGPRINTLYSTRENILESIREADVVIGAVLVPGATAPHLVNREDLSCMKRGSVVVDVAVDQGGCFETSQPTTHTEPTFLVDGIIHYCVANMPGAVSLTSTLALTNNTLSYGLEIANKGLETAIEENSDLRYGLNLYRGECVHQAVAESLNLKYSTYDPSVS